MQFYHYINSLVNCVVLLVLLSAFSTPFWIGVKYLKVKVHESLVRLTPIIGLSIFSIILFLLYLLKIDGSLLLSVIKVMIILFPCLFLICYKDTVFKIIEEKKYRSVLLDNLKISFLFPLLLSMLVILPMIFRDGAVYTPGYNINHDSIVYLTRSKAISDGTHFELEGFGAYTMSAKVSAMMSTYYLISAFTNLLDGSGYLGHIMLGEWTGFENLHIIQVLIFSLSFIPISLITRKIFQKKDYPLWPVFVALISPLVIQYLNQVSFSQNVTAPIFFTIIYYLTFEFWQCVNGKEICSRKIHIVMLSILCIGAIGLYGLAMAIWCVPLYIITAIVNIKKFTTFLVTSLQLFVTFVLIGFGVIYNAIQLFFFISGSGQQEVSLFRMTGNMIGFPSVINSLGVWVSSDFRIENSIPMLKQVSILLFVLALILLIYSFFRLKIDKKSFLIVIGVMVIPMLISTLYWKAPYIYGKTLFYATPIFISLLLTSISILFKRFHWMSLMSIPIIVVYIFMSLYSIFYISAPPASKINSIKFIEKTLSVECSISDNKTLYIDSFDWGRYFLADCDPVAVYDRAFADYTLSSVPYSWMSPIMLSQFDETKVQSFDNIIVANEFLDVAPEGYVVEYEDSSYTVFAKE